MWLTEWVTDWVTDNVRLMKLEYLNCWCLLSLHYFGRAWCVARAGWHWISLPYCSRACRPIARRRKDPKPNPNVNLKILYPRGKFVGNCFSTLFRNVQQRPLFHEKKRKKKDSFLQSERTEGFALRVYTKDLKSKRKKFVTEAYVTEWLSDWLSDWLTTRIPELLVFA